MPPDPRTSRPDPTEYGPYFGRYINLPPDGDIVLFLESQWAEFKSLLSGLSEPESLVWHPPYTWNIKQVVGHLSDCERVFGYRVLWIRAIIRRRYRHSMKMISCGLPISIAVPSSNC